MLWTVPGSIRGAHLVITKRLLLAAGAAAPMLALAPAAFANGDFTVRQNRLFLNARVNGRPVQALLDSAAETSFIDTKFARSIGIAGGETVGARGSGGDTDVQLAKGVKVDALGLHLGPLTVAVLDLSDVGRRLLNGPLAFVLGRELFDAARLYIDIERAEIRTMPASAVPSGAKLALSEERGLETVPAAIEGHAPVGAAFDLGNGGDVLIGADYAKTLGLLSDGRPIVEKKGGGIGGERLRQTLTLKSLELAGRRFTNVSAAIDATGSATKLNIGVPILRKFEIVTDFAGHAVWLNSKYS